MKEIGIVKNPLTVISVFAGTTEISGTVILPFIAPENQLVYMWFLMSFPFILVGAFFFVLYKKHKVLYAPSDYRSDESFVGGVMEGRAARPEVLGFEDSIFDSLERALERAVSGFGIDPGRKSLILDSFKASMESNSFIKIDLRKFTGNNEGVLSFPFVAFPEFTNLTDEVYFRIDGYVEPFEYGYSWVLRDAETNMVIKNSRMIAGFAKGTACPDKRSLKEVGIKPGAVLVVTSP